MAYTQADLDQLQTNIAKGVTTAMLQGEMITFRSLAEMLRLEAKIKRELGVGSPPRLIHTPKTSSGFR